MGMTTCLAGPRRPLRKMSLNTSNNSWKSIASRICLELERALAGEGGVVGLCGEGLQADERGEAGRLGRQRRGLGPDVCVLVEAQDGEGVRPLLGGERPAAVRRSARAALRLRAGGGGLSAPLKPAFSCAGRCALQVGGAGAQARRLRLHLQASGVRQGARQVVGFAKQTRLSCAALSARVPVRRHA